MSIAFSTEIILLRYLNLLWHELHKTNKTNMRCTLCETINLKNLLTLHYNTWQHHIPAYVHHT
jgi:hypothetical protein